MHLTEVAPVTQIRPLRPVAAAVQTSSAVKTAELQTQFVDRSCSCWADRLAEAIVCGLAVGRAGACCWCTSVGFNSVRPAAGCLPRMARGARRAPSSPRLVALATTLAPY